MKAFPTDDFAKNLKNLDLGTDILPIQRSLGLVWNLQTDCFIFRVSQENKPYTRRGVLSAISSVFDPIGFACPITIQGKILFRELIKGSVDWDEPLSIQLESDWNNWKDSLRTLECLAIKRCYTLDSPYHSAKKEIYVFCDASEQAIAASAYMRITDEQRHLHSNLILGKAKVAPSHGHTIPRLELCAAVLGIEIAEIVSHQLDFPLKDIKYFTDSKVVLGYLQNQTRRFYIYVGNRVERIRKSSSPNQWNYIPTNLNPADTATRLSPVSEPQLLFWLHGPQTFPKSADSELFPLTSPDTDKEIRPEVIAMVTSTTLSKNLGTHRFQRFSTWKRLIQSISTLQHIAKSFSGNSHNKCWHLCSESRSVETFKKAEKFVIKQTQQEAYFTEINCIKNNKPLPRDSSILNLDPHLDDDGLLRVGGRLKLSGVKLEYKSPLIIPAKSHIATLLVRFHHEEVKHQGRIFTEGAVRSVGLWIVGVKRLINSILHTCFQCRKLRSQPPYQKMADLPADRLTPSPAFTFVGVDAFGPWPVVTRRTRGAIAQQKRWAVLFTCLVVRAVHIEVIEEMSSSAFINALRRFEAIRGKVKLYRSDRGTNFIGATDPLQINTVNVEDGPIKSYLYNHQVQWIFNPPHSSHMGGSWERMIGTARRVLEGILQNVSTRNLTHDVLVTFMYEVTAIINNRPLVPVSTDPNQPFILSPNMLLNHKTDLPTEPLAQSDIRDLYKAQWRQVQALSEQFWKRWHNGYLHSLQARRKWQVQQPDIAQGDIVMLTEKESPRNSWPTGIIESTIPGEDGRIRKVTVRVIKDGKPIVYTRPICEIILLLPKSEERKL